MTDGASAKAEQRRALWMSAAWMLPAAAAGIAVMLWLWSPVRFEILHGINDFENLYAGARLIGTPGQYDPAAYRDLQLAAAGHTNPSWLFTRLPAFALLLRPLGWLPYRAAYGVWQALSVGALAAHGIFSDAPVARP